MVLTLWCVGNTNTCVFISLLKRHQVVAAIEQKNMLPAPMLKFSQIFSNVLPLVGTIAYAFSEPNDSQKRKIIDEKYSSIAAWLSEVKGIAIYDIDNLVFVIFFVSPIFLLAIVIYTGRDASAACIIMVVIISFHSSVNTLVMCFTFPSFRIAILLFPFRICKNQSRNITIVPPVNNMSGTVQRAKLAVQ
ncbi:hypothetical protein L3Y34_008242 [Caenorhabditis briggsae]|uniref:Uncharacterized protein n=1 Tax=Caenorhabditis briggsae TaxID=6238 RepID=A0AAE9A1Q6_CAEBR|nr:hypothetical protein L3Y34_008242 [Caenorhabditis briggsae]